MRHARAAAIAALSLSLPCGLAAAAPRRPPAAAPAASDDYTPLRDVISVTAGGRGKSPPTATCIVWFDAEGFGLGPAQLDGRRGLSFTINPKPLAGELAGPTSFAAGLDSVKRSNPSLPAWAARVLEANGPAIESACEADHLDPFVVHRITAADTRR